MIRLEVTHGLAKGATLESRSDGIRIGRSPDSDLVLPDEHVSGEHARIVVGDTGYVLRDLRSTNGTAIVRGGRRTVLDETHGREHELEAGDIVEFGVEDGSARLVVLVADAQDESAHVLAMRKIAELGSAETVVESDTSRLHALYAAQSRVGAAGDLSEVLDAICSGALSLIPRATHATIVLRDDNDADPRDTTNFVPVLTHARGGPTGAAAEAIPVTRSVFRKVVSERAAVIAADAPSEVGKTESMLGAQIRSVLGVPLWRGDEILGVLQVDNRTSHGAFAAMDLDVCAVFAHGASLAVERARLVQKLRAAEERLRKENAFLKTREESRRVGKGEQEIIGNSTAMRAMFEQLAKVVDTRVTVLVTGETGSGKELIAAAVHYRSRRRGHLFVTQNCAALPDNLLESELFGHRKGSFTGAIEDKKGLFEIADGGTLFLDEVTEMPAALQSKLLRVLQEGEIRPIGASHERRVNVRIVAATNRDIENDVAQGRFREDLFYRLNVFPIRVPPLRERRDDVPLLAARFLERFGAELGKSIPGFSQQAMELLVAYTWPGNVRELQNEVQRVAIEVEPGEFVAPDLLSRRIRRIEGVIERANAGKGTLKETMDQVERWLLVEALREHDNNKTAAARTLGITREGLHKKLRGLGL
jgi:Nif-specific regulatory protein